MPDTLLADISSFQTVSDWNAYAAWSRQTDGIARVIMRASQGVGEPDASFDQFWSGALASGMDIIVPYHYAYPNLHPGAAGAALEAQYFVTVVGNRLRPQDFVMLDLEQNEDNLWARAFHDALPAALLQVKPVLYDSVSNFNQFFAADMTLAGMFDAVLAAWPVNGVLGSPPSTPPGWTVRWWQYTDNIAPHIITPVPGVSFPVDVNMWLGGTMLQLTDPDVATYFMANPDPVVGGWLCTNGNVLRSSMLDTYVSMPGIGTRNGLSDLALPLTNEAYLSGTNNQATFQVFENGVLIYDPQRVYSSPGGASGPVYKGHLSLAPAPPPTLTPAQQAWLDEGPRFKAALAGI
jgi:GH25 family lysozyme M1 (1,4-beta-N-acetylmuramidase)